MAPRIPDHQSADDQIETCLVNDLKDKNVDDYKLHIVWRNVAIFLLLHVGAFYSIKLIFSSAAWQTLLFAFFLYVCAGQGITAGAHRLWSHRSYKAKWPLRVILCIFNSIAFQNHIYEWSRDHRVHHHYSETDADPHNATRGFFFAHMGWLLCKKHPEVIRKGQNIDCSDLLSDPIVRFQKNNYMKLVLLFCFFLPTVIPRLLWGESLWNAYFICGIFRYCFTLHVTWLINSAAHIWGQHPYDKNISPAENVAVTITAMGEGFHNYHHTFPYDYSASELGTRLNLTTALINFMSWIGWAYDLKRVSPNVLQQRIERTGDGTHPSVINNNKSL